MSRNTPSVLLREGSLEVLPGGVETHPKPFADMASAARLVAGLTWDGTPWEMSPDCRDPRGHGAPWFDAAAFGEMVEAEAEALRAGQGWRVHATEGDYTFWTSLDTYQVTKGEVPSGIGGYGRIEYLIRAQNLHPHEIVTAKGPAADVRAVRAPEGGWHGLVRRAESWDLACAEPSRSPDEARAVALAALAEPAAERDLAPA